MVNAAAHVCAFFNSRDDEYKSHASLHKEGFDVCDRAVYIHDKS
jgi:hypothetical protein